MRPMIPEPERPPELYEADLHPQPDRAGENRPRDEATTTAYDLKPIHDRLRDLPDDVLKQIPILPPGTRLDEGATYFDLLNPEGGEFTGMNNIVADAGNAF